MNEPRSDLLEEVPASVLDAQVGALMQRVIADRDRHCAQMRASTDGQVREMLRAARREARANVREAIVRERKRAEQALSQAQAGAALELRQQEQRTARALLQHMWAAIGGVFEARWTDAAYRKSWLEEAVHQARGLLSDHSWRIEHGAGWPQSERGALAALAAGDATSAAARTVELVCDPTVRAGIRIRAAGACLDATVAGLLASRAEIESEFLAQYLECARAGKRL